MTGGSEEGSEDGVMYSATEAEGAGSLVDQAYEEVLGKILGRSLPAGEIVQESRIAAALGLSRTPVREALGRLEGEGLLVRQGRVLTVRRLALHEYLEVLQLRRLIESEAAFLACSAIDEAELISLRSRVEAMSDRSAVTAAEHWALDDAIHLSIARASGNALLGRLVLDLRRQTALFDLRRVPGRFEPGRVEHLAILDALLARDAAAARDRMRTHIENVKLSIVSHIREF